MFTYEREVINYTTFTSKQTKAAFQKVIANVKVFQAGVTLSSERVTAFLLAFELWWIVSCTVTASLTSADETKLVLLNRNQRRLVLNTYNVFNTKCFQLLQIIVLLIRPTCHIMVSKGVLLDNVNVR